MHATRKIFITLKTTEKYYHCREIEQEATEVAIGKLQRYAYT